MEKDDAFRKNVKLIHRNLMVLLSLAGIAACLLVYTALDPNFSAFKTLDKSSIVVEELIDEDLIIDGIHVRTGLIDDVGLMTVVNNCTNCHGAKLVTQNKMNKERWEATIDWMQESQNLWDLGKNEAIIIAYLVKNYPPENIGRRKALAAIDWYELEVK